MIKDAIKKINKLISNPAKLIFLLRRFTFINFLPDKIFLKLMYKANLDKKLNLTNPLDYNEKLQWLKLYDKNPLYTKLVDKYEVRKYVTETVGSKYLIPLLGVWSNFDDIEFSKLPNQFVLKCTHDSGGLVICTDKSKLNISEARKKINQSLKRNYFYVGREWPYKNVKPRIICEKYMVDESGTGLKDYKFFCFDGVPKALFVATDRGTDTKFDFYDIHFNHLPIKQYYKNGKKESIQKPKGFDEMLKLAGQLSKDIPHVRVDFYDINGSVYFGELTFTHFSGFKKFEPEEYDRKFGELLKITNSRS